MAHLSESNKRLLLNRKILFNITPLGKEIQTGGDVYLFVFPSGRTHEDGNNSSAPYQTILNFITTLHDNATICFFTSPQDAARLQIFFNEQLKFQLWIAVKTPIENRGNCVIPSQHAALLVLTKYKGSLRHIKTRIAYTYCPVCGKTTKDYGGKKHVYHEYGTLMSDVWRDIEVNGASDIMTIIDRLQDVFAIEDYKTIHVVDLSHCVELLPIKKEVVKHQISLFESKSPKLTDKQKLINGDCITELRKIPANSIDFCFTDPPYNLEKKYDGYNDSLELREYFGWCDEWLTELARVIKPGRTLAVLNIPLWSIRHFQHLTTLLQYGSWIVWEALGFPVRMIMPSHYTILCFSKGQPRALPGITVNAITKSDRDNIYPLAESFCSRNKCINDRVRKKINDRGTLTDLWYDIHRLKHNSRRVDHPTQLPPSLMRRLFSLYTNKGEVILDCFNGSGTSTLVAQQMERNFIGIELSDRYHELALKRHQELSLGLDPFGKKLNIPEAKNSKVPRLPKQEYQVSKKMLQLEVKRIAQNLKRLPTREEVSVMGRYPIRFYDEYFISWGEVCAAARTTGMSEYPQDKNPLMIESNLFVE